MKIFFLNGDFVCFFQYASWSQSPKGSTHKDCGLNGADIF